MRIHLVKDGKGAKGKPIDDTSRKINQGNKDAENKL